MADTLFENKRVVCIYKSCCIFLRITILKIILITNNSGTHGMTMNERLNVVGLCTTDGAPPQVEEVGETTSE